MEQASDPVKDRIVKAFPGININNLNKVVSHEIKIFDELGKRRVLTLDNGKQVSYNYWALFYTVSKKDNKIGAASVQGNKDIIDNGTIFNDYDLYVDITPSKRHVFDITPMGGSRKKYRKSSRRGKSAKKSSRTRKFRNRK